MDGIVAEGDFSGASFVRSSFRSSLRASKRRLNGLFHRSSFDLTQPVQTSPQKTEPKLRDWTAKELKIKDQAKIEVYSDDHARIKPIMGCQTKIEQNVNVKSKIYHQLTDREMLDSSRIVDHTTIKRNVEDLKINDPPIRNQSNQVKDQSRMESKPMDQLTTNAQIMNQLRIESQIKNQGMIEPRIRDPARIMPQIKLPLKQYLPGRKPPTGRRMPPVSTVLHSRSTSQEEKNEESGLRPRTETPKKKKKMGEDGAGNRISLDCTDLGSATEGEDEEPIRKRKTPLATAGTAAVDVSDSLTKAPPSSLRGLFTHMKSVRNLGDAIQKSLSMSNLVSPARRRLSVGSLAPAQCQPGAGAASLSHKTGAGAAEPVPKGSPRRRLDSLWREGVGAVAGGCGGLDKSQSDRQEAIFELYRSEVDLLEDLNLVKSTYHDSMLKLRLMTGDELRMIFGQIDGIISLHRGFVDALASRRLPDGTTDSIGQVLLDWVPELYRYVSYCSNLISARALLDARRRTDPLVADFLRRCQDSPFSRRLDLWSFLDGPRSRLVKYPLLLRSILKHTPPVHEDAALLARGVAEVEETVREVDRQTGVSKALFTLAKLDFCADSQRHPLLAECRLVLCDGVLRTRRGVKLTVFLFDKLLVLTRRVLRGGAVGGEARYQVHRDPLPLVGLRLDEAGGGDTSSLRGSFKNAFTSTTQGTGTATHSFRVTVSSGGPSHVLFAHDALDRLHWVQCIQSALVPPPCPSLQRFSSSSSSGSGLIRHSSAASQSSSQSGDLSTASAIASETTEVRIRENLTSEKPLGKNPVLGNLPGKNAASEKPPSGISVREIQARKRISGGDMTVQHGKRLSAAMDDSLGNISMSSLASVFSSDSWASSIVRRGKVDGRVARRAGSGAGGDVSSSGGFVA